MAFTANQYSAALFFAKLNAMADASSENEFGGSQWFTGELVIGNKPNKAIILSPTGATFNTNITMGTGTVFDAQNASQVLVPNFSYSTSHTTSDKRAASVGYVVSAMNSLSRVWNVERTPGNVPFSNFTSGMNIGDIYVYVALPNWDGVTI